MRIFSFTNGEAIAKEIMSDADTNKDGQVRPQPCMMIS